MIQFFLLTVLFSSIFSLDLTPIVTLPSGPIQGKVIGYQDVNVYHFLGIPYAQPPLGKLRLQAPVAPAPWTEVMSTTNFGPICPQVGSFGSQLNDMFESDENCLYLNVYATESAFNLSTKTLRPVLFWIHGGAFRTGSGNDKSNGIPIVPLHDVILVTINYRLNAFGFLYFGNDEPRIPTNLGLRDQLLALQWVHKNIAKFGGDPNKVTIFGESAGAMSVSGHILSPLSKGLFKRAIIESGTIYTGNRNPETFSKFSWSLYNATSCSGSKNILECLQTLNPSELLNNLPAELAAYSLFVGDDFLPYEPEKMLAEGLFDSSIDILLGVEKNEASVFMQILNSTAFSLVKPLPLTYQDAVSHLASIFDEESVDYFRELYYNLDNQESDYLRSQFERAYSDSIFVCPTYIFGIQFISSLRDNIGKVYAYYHTQKPSASEFHKWVGTFHGADLPYVFGHPLTDPIYTEKDVLLSREMMKIWTQFAEKGEMPLINGTEWKPLQEELSAMILDMDSWGQVEKDRIEFCKKQWSMISQHLKHEN